MSWCCNVLFAINEARRFQTLGNELSSLTDNTDYVFRGHWLALGRYDHVFITVAKDADSLREAERKVQHSMSALAHWSSYGRVLGASWDTVNVCFPAQVPPLLGICGIKLMGSVRDVEGVLENLTERMRVALKDISGQWLIMSTTGWEDSMLLFWSDSFQDISAAASKVRSLKTTELVFGRAVEGNHAVLTTCTIPALEIPLCCYDQDQAGINWERWSSELETRINSECPLDWITRFELRPGHLDPFIEALKARLVSEWCGEFSVTKIFGQYDVRIQFQNGTHESWLRFMTRVALPLAARDSSLVRAMETLPHLRIDSNVPKVFSEGEALGEIVIREIDVPDKLSQEIEVIEKTCRESAVADHTIEMLKATRSRLESLGRDDVLRGPLKSVTRVFQSFARGLEQDGANAAKDRDLISWFNHVDRSLADRYRGTYPTGDVLVPRLASYQASHHAFLQAADSLAQAACDLATAHIVQRAISLSLGPPSRPLPDLAVCCYIGNSPSPNATSLVEPMRCGFIELPAALVFNLRSLDCLLHEAGHVVVNAFVHYCDPELGELLQKATQDSKFTHPIQHKQGWEILAEIFSRHLCFGNDASLHFVSTEKTIKTYLPDPSNLKFNNTDFLYKLRLVATTWVIDRRWANELDVKTMKDKFFSDMWFQFRAGIPAEDELNTQIQIAEFAWAVAQIVDHAKRFVGFENFLDGLKELSCDVKLKGSANGRRILAFRQFIRASNPLPPAHSVQTSLSDDFRSIERWCALK